MKGKLELVPRYILGLIYFVFGLNGFLNFIPPPPDMPEQVMSFFNAMMQTGYFFPVVKGTEVICGLMLLAGFAVPVSLVILAPISIQILLFHGFLTPGLQNLIMPLVIIAMHVLAAKKYWHLYRPLFK